MKIIEMNDIRQAYIDEDAKNQEREAKMQQMRNKGGGHGR